MKNKIDGINTDLIVLTPNNYRSYIEDFPIRMDANSELPLKFRVDMFSAYVLHKYGGLFLSPGTIVKNISDIFVKLLKSKKIKLSVPYKVELTVLVSVRIDSLKEFSNDK